MKHKLALAVCAMAAVMTLTPSMTQAASNSTCQILTSQGTVISGSSIEELQAKLQELGISVDLSDCDIWNNLHSPTNPEAPETPAVPETPDTPDSPQQPETPEVPDSPQQPEAPDTPDSSQQPDNMPSNAEFIQQVVNLVNQERSKAGLSPVTADATLQSAAQIRAKEIEISFSHTRPDGSSFSSVLSQQGISYRGAGENIAWGQRSPEEVMEGWMNSPGHRANILNASFTKLGVGYYQNAAGTNYWSQLFTY